LRTRAFEAVLGYPAEIVPLTNPYLTIVGDTLAVRCLVDGQPVAQQLVIAGGERDTTRIPETRVRTAGGMVSRAFVDPHARQVVRQVHSHDAGAGRQRELRIQVGHSHVPGALTWNIRHSVLSLWESFYVIVGSSGAGLTGLMFVVITIAGRFDRRPHAGNAQRVRNAERDPLCRCAPHRRSAQCAMAAVSRILRNVVGATALAGIVYLLIVVRRMLRQTGYKPVLEDWVWHAFLPMTAYAALFVGAAGLSHDQIWALFLIAAVSLLLLGIGSIMPGIR